MSQNAYEVTLELAEAYIQNKEYQKALSKYKVLLDKATPREAKTVNALICELYIKWAIEKTSEEKYTEAFDMLTNAALYNVMNPEIYYNNAQIHYLQRNYNSCVEQLNKAIEYDRDKKIPAKCLILLADAHHQLGNFFEEKKSLSDLLKYDDKNAEGLLRLGIMYAAQHDIKNAEETFKKALVNDPELIQAKYNLALLYEINNRDKAKELYMEILDQDPTFEDAKNALSELSASDGY